MSVFRVTSKSISTPLNNASICRGFVSATRPSQEAKVDKETCGKVIDAAELMKGGMKEVVKEVKQVNKIVTKKVVKEVKQVRKVVTNKVANTTGNVVADVAKEGLGKASEKAETEKNRDVLDTAKVAAETFKEKVDKK